MLKSAEQRLLQRRNRANRMMVSMVVMFAVSWAPLNLINGIRDFNLYHVIPQTAYSVVFAFCHCTAMTSVIVNPVAYSFYNETFRKAMIQMMPAMCISKGTKKRCDMNNEVTNCKGTRVEVRETVVVNHVKSSFKRERKERAKRERGEKRDEEQCLEREEEESPV